MIRSATGDSNRKALGAEVAERCAQLLSARDWNEVGAALLEMHEQLREDIPDDSEFTEVFGEMVAALIARLGSHAVESRDQAHVYTWSGDPEHRARASIWLKGH